MGMGNTERTAVLLMAYGTPRAPDEIAAYYTDIRRGRPPSDEQLADLTARYEAIGGLSPLAARTEAQQAALQQELDVIEPGHFHVALGLKHAHPSIETAVAELAAAGFQRAIGLVAAPHYSSLSIGEYLRRATDAGAQHDIAITGIESWATEPAFVGFTVEQVRAQLARLPHDSKVVFTAHSLPLRVREIEGDRYAEEVRATATAVAAGAGLSRWNQWATAWQSASPTQEPWLGPDVLEVIDELAASENAANHSRGILVCAVGFVADHLEVLYDLDVVAARRAADHGLAFARTACVNDDQRVMAALATRIAALR